ncbi:MAG: lamin tail domain-containing protein [bacterium]|nr:lamin tail domain-containing protein [bacterium]
MQRLFIVLVSVLVPLPVGASPSPLPSPTPTVAPSPAVPAPLPGELRINELLPNPEGADTGREWIELKNVSSHEVLLEDVTVRRESGSKLASVLPGTVLSSGSVLLLSDLSGSLVNGGDTLLLFSDEVELDRVTYDKAENDQTWSRINDTEGVWTAMGTPGEENPTVPSGSSPAPAGTAAPSPTDAVTVESDGVPAATQRPGADKLPKAGPGGGPYALAVALATLYAWQRMRRRS